MLRGRCRRRIALLNVSDGRCHRRPRIGVIRSGVGFGVRIIAGVIAQPVERNTDSNANAHAVTVTITATMTIAAAVT